MSMGPDIKKEQAGLPILSRLAYTIKKSASKFFDRPIFYLFYISLTATMIGLFFDIKFSPLYFILLFALWVAEVSNEFDLFNLKNKRKNTIDTDHA